MFHLLRIQYRFDSSCKDFLARVEGQSNEVVTVRAAACSQDDCRKLFGVPMFNRGVQPVWIQVENHSHHSIRLLPTSISPNYYTPREAAAVCHFSIVKQLIAFGLMVWFFLALLLVILPFRLWAIRRANQRMDDRFLDAAFPNAPIGRGETAEGFIYTPVVFGTKAFDVKLLTNQKVQEYHFSVSVPNPAVDYHGSRFLKSKIDGDEGVAVEVADVEPDEACNLITLQERLRAYPQTTSALKHSRSGDPVNLVVVGDFDRIMTAFAGRWDQTEIITLQSCYRTVEAFLLGREYRYSPVSALYLFGRSQDFALQRIRSSINERLHLRLWYTPLTFEGQRVWIGQISRDIGVRFTWSTWNLTTHRIEADVDESRDYLLEDLYNTRFLESFGYVAGGVACSKDDPRHNLTGDPYFTDGKRAIAVLSNKRTEPTLLCWE